MRHPWANTVLLVLLALQAVSGFIGLISGADEHAWALWLHGVGAYAIVVGLLWKSEVILGSLGRRKVPAGLRGLFLFMAALLVSVLGSGLYWTFAGRVLIAGYSLISLHIVLALALMLPLAWHVLFMRSVFRVPSATDRRAFLRLTGLVATGFALWQGAGRAMAAFGLPGAVRRFTGSYETGSATGEFPVVTWLFDRPPPVDPSRWLLTIDGHVEREVALTYEELTSLPNDTEAVLIDCTGGWYSTQEWTGARVGNLLERAGVRPGAQSITFQAVSGYSRRYPLEEACGLMLATRVAGQVLSHEHGYPARLVAPNHRGFEWVKWVTRITVEETSSLLQPPVPMQ